MVKCEHVMRLIPALYWGTCRKKMGLFVSCSLRTCIALYRIKNTISQYGAISGGAMQMQTSILCIACFIHRFLFQYHTQKDRKIYEGFKVGFFQSFIIRAYSSHKLSLHTQWHTSVIDHLFVCGLLSAV